MWFTWTMGVWCALFKEFETRNYTTKTTCRFTIKMAGIYLFQFLKLSSCKNISSDASAKINKLGGTNKTKQSNGHWLSPMNSHRIVCQTRCQSDMRLAAIPSSNKNSNSFFHTENARPIAQQKLRKICKRTSRFVGEWIWEMKHMQSSRRSWMGKSAVARANYDSLPSNITRYNVLRIIHLSLDY